MAQRVSVSLESDLSGQPGDETVTFSLDGTLRQIDLTTDEAALLRDTLAPYIAAGRRATSGDTRHSRPSPTRSSSGGSRRDGEEIRAWSRRHNIEVNERGRIPGRIVAAFDAQDPTMAGGTSHTPNRAHVTPAPDDRGTSQSAKPAINNAIFQTAE